MTRRVFYSFHYEPDSWRSAQVRNIGAIEEGEQKTLDNSWEQVRKDSAHAIKLWIHGAMSNRTCTIVLVGENTATRHWINYEIEKSWNDKMGIVGIRIHGLKNAEGQTAAPGNNPFDFVARSGSQDKLSQIVKCYNPTGTTSTDRYDWIGESLKGLVEEAISIRNQYS